MAIFTAIAGAIFGAGTFLAAAGAFVLQTAAGIGLSYLAKAIAGKPDAPESQKSHFSAQGTLQFGGDVPRSFNLGYGMTAGSLIYANTWGRSGETPNAYFTQVIALSDLPQKGLAGVWINGEKVTLTESAPSASGDVVAVWTELLKAAISVGISPFSGAAWSNFSANWLATNGYGGSTASGGVTEFGLPVLEYRKDGKDHVWIKFYDGSQAAADNFLVTRVGSADRPYPATRVGTGVAYAICTSLVEDTLFTGFPAYKFELTGAALYDPSKDDTAGGVGDHRYSDPSTWGGDGDDLPAVQIYNLLRGFRYGDRWLYGLQSLPAARAPSSNWIAQINKCRAEIDGEDGPEPTYRSGGQINVNNQLADTIEALLTSCQGKMSEIGGTYKMHCGAPDSATFQWVDGDIISTEEQSFTPFFGLSDTINGVAAKYPSPAEGWNTKPAPPVLRPDFEAQDGNRRLMADVSLDFVPYAAQVQRLMKSALDEARRARRHTFVMPPEFWLVEPGDIGEWTSARNGYAAKKFRVDGVLDKTNLDVMLDLTEVDPADYAWDHATDFVPVIDGPTIFPRPAAQAIVDWFAEGAIIKDTNGVNRRPAILLSWDGDMDDVEGVEFEVRLKSSGVVVHSGRTDNPAAGSILISQSLLPNMTYEARGRYIPGSFRLALWSDWLTVATPNILFSVLDFDDSLNQLVTGNFASEAERLDKVIQLVAATVVQALAKADADKQILRSEVSVARGDLSASIEETRTVAVTANEAVAELKDVTEAAIGDQSVKITQNTTAIAEVDGKLVGAYSVVLDVDGYQSGWQSLNDGTFAPSILRADLFQIAWPGVAGGDPTTIFQIANVNGEAKLSFRGDMFADGSITAKSLDVAELSAITANFGDATFSGAARGATGRLNIEFDNDRIVVNRP